MADLDRTGLTIVRAEVVHRSVTTDDGERTAIDALVRSRADRMTGRMLLASPLGFRSACHSAHSAGAGRSRRPRPRFRRPAPAEATTSSLIVVGAASVVGAARHWRHGRVRAGPGLLFGLLGIAAPRRLWALNRRLDGDILLLAFAGLILVAAWRTVACCPSCTRGGETTALRDCAGTGAAGRGPRRPATSTRLLKLVASAAASSGSSPGCSGSAAGS